jgi:hypothetical protein
MPLHGAPQAQQHAYRAKQRQQQQAQHGQLGQVGHGATGQLHGQQGIQPPAHQPRGRCMNLGQSKIQRFGLHAGRQRPPHILLTGHAIEPATAQKHQQQPGGSALSEGPGKGRG